MARTAAFGRVRPIIGACYTIVKCIFLWSESTQKSLGIQCARSALRGERQYIWSIR